MGFSLTVFAILSEETPVKPMNWDVFESSEDIFRVLFYRLFLLAAKSTQGNLYLIIVVSYGFEIIPRLKFGLSTSIIWIIHRRNKS